MESIIGLITLATKDNGKIIILMDKVNMYGQMAEYIQVNGKKN